ncbi:MAG: hypothetical protein ACT4NY_26100 [Pseudonocardiales bacterium]
MSDVVSFAEIDGQQVELLPARTLQTGGSDPAAGGDLLGALTSGGGGDLFGGLTGGGDLLGGLTGGLGG